MALLLYSIVKALRQNVLLLLMVVAMIIGVVIGYLVRQSYYSGHEDDKDFEISKRTVSHIVFPPLLDLK